MLYESSRDESLKINPSQAIVQGLSSEGGLFVLKNLGENKIELDKIIGKSYYQIAHQVLKLFLDFTEEEIEACVDNAYKGKFSTEEITPLVELSDSYILELFHGPTSAFKDLGLSLLPQLTKTALDRLEDKDDILILTATSGDTGKAALEGFKDVDKVKIMVFYPNSGVSKVQERQMKIQDGKNVKVCAIEGNFDDAQSAIKEIFVDEKFKEELSRRNVKLSSANSINIGRLIPQVVYYFKAYSDLVVSGKIKRGDKVNFVVPTGNFGNILAGYYAKKIGLPVNNLVCASNANNVLYDFLTEGVYDRNRDFLKTISPSMDILISSNLERLLYYLTDGDNTYVNSLMTDLKEKGKYQISAELLAKLQGDFIAGYATNEETAKVIKEVYEKEGYLLDTHTAVGYKVLLEQELDGPSIVLSTASPYKFTGSVYESLFGQIEEADEFKLLVDLHEKTRVKIPSNLENLDKKEVLHNDLISKEEIAQYVAEKLGDLS
ncbi:MULTISPECIES: threonine synthase [unclassified Gemella]|uniref:threonine synthase n=1 Tax=unclassified Gemella TaxID=2624949 RepID=UPI0015CFEEE0|nr:MULTISPECIES: threonine synthase [unclassified Gemella]MBF0709634.1 threonine synthase [Gemella sp. GL1.1]NYS26978.1 threonine synthase [Gemella sp. GL1]